MTNLHLEALEIEGAQKLLLRLQQEWAFSIVPTEKRELKEECKDEGKTSYDYFEIPTNMRKMYGDGMIRCLLESKDNMRKFLYGGEISLKAVRHLDKKGKVTKVDIEIKEE